MRNLKDFYCALILCLTICPFALAQINFKIGYNPAFGSFRGINQILDQYDPEGTDLMKGFKDLRFMHGIQLGVRYSIGATAFELGWDHLNRDRNALSFNSNSEVFTSRVYNFSMNSILFGVDRYFSMIGLGTFLTSTTLKINREIGDNKLDLISDRQWGLRIHLNWILQQSDYVSVVLKPFMQLPLNPYHLDTFAEDINSLNTSGNNEKSALFGLSFVFYNGRQ